MKSNRNKSKNTIIIDKNLLSISNKFIFANLKNISPKAITNMRSNYLIKKILNIFFK